VKIFKNIKKNMKYLKTFESYTFEDFTQADMEDVRELFEEGLTAEQIAVEMGFSLEKVKQIISSLNKNQSFDQEDDEEYDPFSYEGCGCCPVCTGERDCECGCPECNCPDEWGMQAWNAGHRPGVAQHQWGMGRVNSFITGSGGARKADANLWAKAKPAKARKKKKK